MWNGARDIIEPRTSRILTVGTLMDDMDGINSLLDSKETVVDCK